MSAYVDKLIQIYESKSLTYWGERILAQIGYAHKLSKINNEAYSQLLEDVSGYIYDQYTKGGGTITKEAAQKAENMLSELQHKAKQYKMVCAAHAHIDMNWMWGWPETVTVTLDTFRTMLDLMEEYPEFKFSQSQASVYKIMEEYAPGMLQKVKKRIHEGRWEVTASTWVEADKNMPNGESMARHILYTKQYLSGLLDIDPDTLDLDFEPDTFGHSQNVPEILAAGGVKYYYHCRGYEGHFLYKWKAPSGKSIIVCREPFWYNAEINPYMALYVPEFCAKHGLDTMLKVYGVGDHGGGPTRRDLERIIDMNSWPVFPEIRFGTFKEFYKKVDEIADQLPVVEGELNFVFTGCYTTQTRIKMANRISEAALHEAEAFNSISDILGVYDYDPDHFKKGWENTLFNQFHDIIPGSGVIDTREYAMGLFQDTVAIANSRKGLALQAISSHIDTAQFVQDDEDKEVFNSHVSSSTSEGAGVGFGAGAFKVTQSHRGRGKTRVFHVFNPSPIEREEPAEVVIWDWQGDINRVVFKDADGNKVEHQLLDQGFNNYWGHSYLKALVKARVPAYGYATYILTEEKLMDIPMPFPKDPRVESMDKFVLENNCLRAVFSTRDASLISLVDKSNDEEYVEKGHPAAIFRLIREDTDKGMTAWIVGRYKKVENLNRDVRIKKVQYRTENLRQSLIYNVAFGSSSLKVTVSLEAGRPQLRFDVECDWHEIGRSGESIPQLNFFMPLGYKCEAYKYDIPFGTIVREGMDMDVPANSWALGIRQEQEKKSLMIVTDSKYGFRCVDNAMAVTLIRSSYDPDPYPELGNHKFGFTVGLIENTSNRHLIQYAYNCTHPLSVISGNIHKGNLPANQGFIEFARGNFAISAIKMPDEKVQAHKIIIRGYETEGKTGTGVIRFNRDLLSAHLVDINEKKLEAGPQVTLNGREICFQMAPWSIFNVCVEFK